MAIIVTPYNHTTARFLSGANAASKTYKINLYSVLPANPTATTKAAAESGATQLPTANGYTQDDKIVTGWAITTISTNGAKLDADDPTWTTSGGNIVADFGMVFCDTDAEDPPVFRVDFGGTITATLGVPFVVEWNAGNGLYTLNYP
jgi:hypothetical protein